MTLRCWAEQQRCRGLLPAVCLCTAFGPLRHAVQHPSRSINASGSLVNPPPVNCKAPAFHPID